MIRYLLIFLCVCSVQAMPLAQRQQSSLWSGLVSHWCLNEGAVTVRDSAIGSTRTGTLTTNTWGTGYIGQAVQFPSPPNVGFNILCTTSPISVFPFTIATRFNTSYANSTAEYMFTHGNTTNDALFYALLINTSGKLTMGFRNLTGGSGGIISQVTNTVICTNGLWHTGVGIFYQTNHMALYQDGAFVSSNISSAGGGSFIVGAPPVDNMTIGCWRRTTLLLPYSGLIDECDTWNRALTPDEIIQLNNSFQ